MYIEQLIYLVEVMKTKSIAAASENLHLTQPAISQSITSLEKELGVKLFVRSRRGAIPTAEGKILAHKASEVLMKLEEFHQQADAYNSYEQGSVTISSVPVMMPIVMNSLSKFKTLYPNIHIEVIERTGPEIMKGLQQGAFDFGLISSRNIEGYDGQATFESIVDGKIQVLVSKKSLFSSFETLSIEDIKDQLFALYNSSLYKESVDRLFPNPVKTLFLSNNFEILKEAVALDSAIGLVLDFYIKNDRHVSNGDIVPIDLIGHPYLSLKHGWTKSRTKQLSEHALKFLQFIKSEASY
ncbi:LysR family transcriptional regulator [Peribacillus muralis]|uniref:LysR family transcriptional regulator n=1 Tax=Peribacillus muralis TaxID=264697 RepID=UPI001F4E4ED2|nr:LysR family transcriptional regulator [Peribacillus muralis]MCK1992378.1 LysR family transcriptional regulator [Peribacillus muralis]MCK2012934.1 LysR family transcriptional regulator [Peribacillus muralis]